MTRAPRPWVPHKPEQRFSVVVSRFLDEALVPPFWASAQHDADEGGRNDRQRARDRERGVKPGALDWDVAQQISLTIGIWRKLELKRKKNILSDNQKVTIKILLQCGMMPVVAYDLRQVYHGLAGEGFRFKGNVETLLQKYEAQLEAMDRTAELTLSGNAPAKKSRARKPEPRTTAPKSVTKRWTAAGLKF